MAQSKITKKEELDLAYFDGFNAGYDKGYRHFINAVKAKLEQQIAEGKESKEESLQGVLRWLESFDKDK